MYCLQWKNFFTLNCILIDRLSKRHMSSNKMSWQVLSILKCLSYMCRIDNYYVQIIYGMTVPITYLLMHINNIKTLQVNWKTFSPQIAMYLYNYLVHVLYQPWYTYFRQGETATEVRVVFPPGLRFLSIGLCQEIVTSSILDC